MAEEREKRLSERREERAPSIFEEVWMESPMRMLQRMREDLNRMFGGFPGFGRMMPSLAAMGAMMPSVDVWETENDVMVSAELPGVDPNNVEIFTTEDSLRIRGEMKREEEQREKGVYRAERRFGMFDRTIPLPAEIQPDQAKATFKHGIMEIRLPKTQQAKEKMKKVPIESEEMAGTKGGEAKQQGKQEKKK
jgi:HSP20 family protein